jgi:DNA-binding transcriptional LysR family regulator
MKPTLKQLEALYWTGTLGSFQAAADHLHTTQSAIAKRIHELQDIFEVSIIDSGFRRAKLTEQGRRLMDSAAEVLAASQRMMENLQRPTSFSGTFRLGVSELVAITWLPELIKQIKREHPRAVIELEVAPGGAILDKLTVGQIDLAFVAGPMWNQDFDSVELAEVEYQWMASPDLGVPDRVITPIELATYPVLLHSLRGVVSQFFAQWQRVNGFSSQRTFTTNSLLVMIQMTMAGLGISGLPTLYVQEHARAGRLVQVRTTAPLPAVKYFAVYRAADGGPFIKQVIRLAKSLCDFGMTEPIT